MLETLGADERMFFDAEYQRDESSATVEQIAVMVEYAGRQFMSKAQILHELTELHRMRNAAFYAKLQFPCVTADGKDAVRAHTRNKMSDIYNQIDNDMIPYRRMARMYDNDEAYMDKIWKMQDDKADIEQQLQDKWNAIKHDMYPAHLWTNRIVDDHERALKMNCEFDKAVNIEAALQMLPEEQQALLRKELR